MLTHHPVEGWRVRATAGPVPPHLDGLEVAATVPGTVHTDLLAAGLIPDPYLDDNEAALAWIGARTGATAPTFALPPPAAPTSGSTWSSTGLDTVATVALNGVVLGAHREHAPLLPVRRARRWPCDGRGAGCADRRLRVARWSTPRPSRRGSGPGRAPTRSRYNMVRKMACNFGWDWGPDLLTAGIWRPVTAASAGGRPGWPRCGRWSPSTRRPPARVAVHVDVERVRVGAPAASSRSPSPAAAAPRSTVGSRTARRVAAARGRPTPALWWPRGYGEQPLCTTSTVTLLDRRRHRAGHVARAGSASAPSSSTPRPTSTARRSRSWSTAARSSSRAPTGSPTTPARPGSPASGYARRLDQAVERRRQPAAGLGRRHLRERGLLRALRRARAAGLAGLPASPAPPTPRRSRCAARSRPRPASTSPG